MKNGSRPARGVVAARPRCAFLLPLLFLSSVAASRAAGQSFFYMKEGLAPFDEFGFTMAPAGDVDGDGIGDLVVGADESSPGGILDAGSAFIVSGRDGSLLRRFDGEAVNDFLGWSVDGCGDIDADGAPDVVVGAPFASPNARAEAGYAAIFSSATGARLHKFDGAAPSDQTGMSVAGAGDLDGDSVPDVLVGAPLADVNGRSNTGSVYVYSGADGHLIRRLDGVAQNDQFGFSVASIDDLSGDGVRDVLVGAPNHDGPPGSNSGAVFVISGADGAPVFDTFGPMAQATFGTAVAAVGDVDGDLYPDFIGGAPTANQPTYEKGGRVLVLGGFDGAVLRSADGEGASHRLGTAVAGVGDLDDDGVLDFAAGASNANPGGLANAGSAYFYSGATGLPFYRLDGSRVGIRFGRSIASPGDINRDGYADVAIGAEEWSRGSERGVGSVWFHSGAVLPFAVRRGNVNLATGSPSDIVTVNGSAGSPVLREVAYDPFAPLSIDVALPPSRAGKSARFALWVFGGVPVESTRSSLFMAGSLVGDVTFPYPGDPRTREPIAIWNNLGKEAILGVPTRTSAAAPGFAFDLPSGIRREFLGTIQGVIYDTASLHGRLAVTNAVILRPQ